MFGNPDALQRLNGIVWPALPDMFVREFNAGAAATVAARGDAPLVGVLEAALLVEAGMTRVVDEVLCLWHSLQ